MVKINWLMSTMVQIGKTLEQQTVGSFSLPTDRMFLGSDTILMEVYGSNGKRSARYYFIGEENIGLTDATKPGWYDANFFDKEGTVYDEQFANDEVIPFGHGVIITSGEDPAPITMAGEVDREDRDFILYHGVTWIGNCTPVDITLGDMAIPTDQMFLGSDTIVLEMYNTLGKREARYYFIDEENIGLTDATEPGWYDADFFDKEGTVYDAQLSNDVKVDSGRMVVITSGEDQTTITIPSAAPVEK